jgi:hypothetical protein
VSLADVAVWTFCLRRCGEGIVFLRFSILPAL